MQPVEAERRRIEEQVTADLTAAEREQLLSALSKVRRSAAGLLRGPGGQGGAAAPPGDHPASG